MRILAILNQFSIALLLIGKEGNAVNHDVLVDLTSPVGDLRRIWDNTGLSPPGPGEDAVKYLTSKDMLVNLALIGSLPFKAITHVRIHWLLDLIKVRDKSTPEYDFSELDELLGWLRSFRMRPSFELMGNPGQLFNDLNSNPKTVTLWQHFVTDLVEHLVDKFGKEEVSKWRFELWNEPDSKQYNILNLTDSSYLKYASATGKALVFQGIGFSGPAGTFRDFIHHNKSWGFLQVCNNLISSIGTCEIEEITFHKKGEGNPEVVVNSTLEFYRTVARLYPQLKNLSFANNEADILSGWWREENWRGDVTYASYVCEVITLFFKKIKSEGLPLAYISNDNGFMNVPPAYFDQRTLLTRFQTNNSEGTQEFVRKPVMVTMAMLSYLGPKELLIHVRNPDESFCDSRLSILGGSDGAVVGPGWSAAVVISCSLSKATFSSQRLDEDKLGLLLILPQGFDKKYVVYQLDNEQTNPRRVWELHGKPKHPSMELLKKMRANEGPVVTQSGRVAASWLFLNLTVRSPSVTLVHVCTNPGKPPAKVLQLRALNITFNEVLLLWQDSDTRCVKTYQVYFCSGECQTNDFRRISDGMNIMLSYQFIAPTDSPSIEGTKGRYKVRAQDYWDRDGDFSDVLLYG